jgi:AbiTii-like protein
VTTTPGTRRAEALRLAEELLDDCELSRLSATDLARKASRLARLLDDTEATAWLQHEVGGFPPGNPDASAIVAARRSNRHASGQPGGESERYWTTSLGEIEATIEASTAQLAAAEDKPISLTTQNLQILGAAVTGNREERAALANQIREKQGLREKIIGAIYEYAAARYQELRFGSAVETAFEVVRADVDARIAELVPDALPKLSAAFENATSDNPEHWANAASTCRRLLKAAADALRPPGEPVNGRPMTDMHYINRLVDWIARQSGSATTAEMIQTDLEYLGRRLDAALGAGTKGAHAEVDRFAAARFVTGTYLLPGDILRLRGGDEAAGRVQGEPTDLPAEPEAE